MLHYNLLIKYSISINYKFAIPSTVTGLIYIPREILTILFYQNILCSLLKETLNMRLYEMNISSLDARIESTTGEIEFDSTETSRDSQRYATRMLSVAILATAIGFLVGIRVVCSARLCAASSRQTGSPPPSLSSRRRRVSAAPGSGRGASSANGNGFAGARERGRWRDDDGREPLSQANSEIEGRRSSTPGFRCSGFSRGRDSSAGLL